METIQQPSHFWTASRRFWFRFFCSFFIIYLFPYPINNIPFSTHINKINGGILGWYTSLLRYVDDFWHWFVPVVGKYIVGIKQPITTFTNGSGDTTYDWVMMLTIILLSVLSAIIWTFADSKRRSYNTAYYWLCVLVRYFLAAMMLSYGFTKVFHVQMPYPYLSRLVQPYGDSSPMGLAWTYVGQSKAFSQFVGWSEVCCGVLLLFRKTSLVGSILSIIVMGNVVVINMCYDVPVKIFSSALELMAFYLTAPFFPALNTLFIKHRPAVLVQQQQPVFKKRWMLTAVRVLKFLFIVDAVFYGVFNNIENSKKYGDDRTPPPLYGIYNVETVIRNHDTIPPLTTDTTRWKQLVIQNKDFAKLKLMNDTVYNYNFQVDTLKKTAVVFPGSDTLNKSHFNYTRDSTYITLTGKMKSDSVYMRLKRYDEKRFRLMTRGFHWVNEFPFNR